VSSRQVPFLFVDLGGSDFELTSLASGLVATIALPAGGS
jgi:hypothetical protein